ncbi:MAG TPA: glutamate synthase subunit beta [Acidimicrobiales bacterium]|nr:glutamate synthase subunit beta [Acidimicrobiales bacterium]
MGDPTAFIKRPRKVPSRRPLPSRLQDWQEIYVQFSRKDTASQASRCVSCGIAYCNFACPLGNFIPDWNDLVYRGRWRDASERLHATNNFPELTGRLCPAPCEPACSLSVNDMPVANAVVERKVAEVAFAEGWVGPVRPRARSGRKVGVIGSGPAGLAAAQQLTRAGHEVTVFERSPGAGGLLRYGIPDFKLEKWVLGRRLAQMHSEGARFFCGVEVGVDITVSALLGRGRFDALLLAGGARAPRDLDVPGRRLRGVYQAIQFLVRANRAVDGETVVLGEPAHEDLSACAKRVVVVGGGDTGADCVSTALRQGASSVTQLEIMPEPSAARDPWLPWLGQRSCARPSAAAEEGGRCLWSASPQRFLPDGAGHVRGVATANVRMELEDGRPNFLVQPGTERVLEADLVLLAMGFKGAERSPLLAQLDLPLTADGKVARDDVFATAAPGVFACGDMARGQSLVAWAIAEGRSAAHHIDETLMGETLLPCPLGS